VSNRKCVSCSRVQQAVWRKENPDEHCNYQLNWKRNRDIKRATPRWANEIEIERIYKECERLSREMGIPLLVAHEIPLRGRNVCGLHVAENLRVVSKSWAKRRREQILRGWRFSSTR